MTLRSIEARCRRCDQDFPLAELGETKDGLCPRCGWMLTSDWTPKLLEDARRAEAAHGHLLAALKGLRRLPGIFVVRPHTVLRNLFDDVGWQHDLRSDPSLLRAELAEIRHLFDDWLAIDPTVAPAQPEPTRRARVWRWLTGKQPRRHAPGRTPVSDSLRPALLRAPSTISERS
jgi:hypothetical protein